MANNNGLVVKESNHSFDDTYNKLIATLEANPNLKVILELDHSKNAASVDLSLRPTKIVLFGNPKLGTHLMAAGGTTAIDLPQKIVVFEENNKVHVCYNDPAYLKSRHVIEGQEEILNKVSGALNKITDGCTG